MPDLSRVAATNFRRNDGCRPENKNGPCPATTGGPRSDIRPRGPGAEARPKVWGYPPAVRAAWPASRLHRPGQGPFDVMRVAPREVAARRRDHVLGLGFELLRPVPVRRCRLRVSRHLGPGVLHQLVGPA